MLFKWPSSNEGKLSRILTVLDIGSSKIVCLIARLNYCGNAPQLYARLYKAEILGYGIRRSSGIKSGLIMDIMQAEKSIRLAVAEAESMAKVNVDSIIVTMNAGRLSGKAVEAQIALSSEVIGKECLQELLQQVVTQSYEESRLPIHSLPIHYKLDDRIVDSPLAMVGSSLAVNSHVLSVDASALQNLELCLSRAMLNVEAVVCTPLASSLAVLLDEEADLGALCLDIGAGTTNFSVYNKKRMVYAGSVPVGGDHITYDIARGLKIDYDSADVLKKQQGLVNSSAIYEGLAGIITARAEEILYMVKEQLLVANYTKMSGKSLVLTGGGAQLPGLTSLAQRIFGMQARLGRPLGVSRLPSFAKTSAYAAAVGLLVYPQYVGFNDIYSFKFSDSNGRVNSKIKQLGKWGRNFMRMIS